MEQSRREGDEFIEDLTQLHEDVPQYKKVPDITQQQFDIMKRREQKMVDRHKPVRAPYKKNKVDNSDKLKIFKSERKARSDPNYELLKDEELEEVDDENKAPNPHVLGGDVEKK